MDRRGQSISINVIVIAAIALLILVILSVLVLREGRTTTQGTSCEQLGGTCSLVGDIPGSTRLNPCGPDTSGYTWNRAGQCQQQNEETAYCCLRI